MENINPCNIQRSLGEIRCLFCFVYLTLIVLLFLYMVFLRNKNGLWLLKQTPTCQGGKEAFGLIERSSSFFLFKVKQISDPHGDDEEAWSSCLQTGRPSLSYLCVEVWGFIRSSSFSFDQERGPEVSCCPAVLGDVDPYWGVYECVTFTLFALMYITMSRYSKFILNKYR